MSRERVQVDLDQLEMQPFKAVGKDWFLLNAGTMDKCNPMTIAWGSFGVMWGKPFAQVVVRPQRYTRELLDPYGCFTLNYFGEGFREQLAYCGSHSGRDYDKIAASKLSLIPSLELATPGFAEAQLIFECRVMFRDQFRPENFCEDDIEGFYPDKDYHYIYFGEILKVTKSV